MIAVKTCNAYWSNPRFIMSKPETVTTSPDWDLPHYTIRNIWLFRRYQKQDYQRHPGVSHVRWGELLLTSLGNALILDDAVQLVRTEASVQITTGTNSQVHHVTWRNYNYLCSQFAVYLLTVYFSRIQERHILEKLAWIQLFPEINCNVDQLP